jgi:hypothetical protein
MPAGGFSQETYEKQQNKLFHFSESLSYKKPKKIVKVKLPNDQTFELEIKELDSILKLSTFTFPVSSVLIDDMKGDTKAKKYYQLQDLDIDDFFGKKKAITIALSNIKPDTLDEFTVYDGRPFTFYFVYKIANQDTTKFKYFGNFDDGVKAKNIKDWLPLYLLINKHRLFSTNKHVTEFFDDKHFISVLFRFIDWSRH